MRSMLLSGGKSWLGGERGDMEGVRGVENDASGGGTWEDMLMLKIDSSLRL